MICFTANKSNLCDIYSPFQTVLIASGRPWRVVAFIWCSGCSTCLNKALNPYTCINFFWEKQAKVVFLIAAQNVVPALYSQSVPNKLVPILCCGWYVLNKTVPIICYVWCVLDKSPIMCYGWCVLNYTVPILCSGWCVLNYTVPILCYGWWYPSWMRLTTACVVFKGFHMNCLSQI